MGEWGGGPVDNVCESGEGDRWIMCVGVGRGTGG